MNTNSRHYVETLLGSRRNSTEILAIAVLLAFGVNIASSGLVSLFGLSPAVSTIIGIALTVLGIAYLVIRLRPMAKRELILDGILPMTSDREVYEIDRYELAEKLHSYFGALTSENKAIAKLSREGDIGFSPPDEEGPKKSSRGQANALIREAIEYFALNELSLHLSEYFDSERDVEEHTIVRIQRSDIPHILLENRFLELFSKPMEMREAFMENGAAESKHKVVYATGKDGALYDYFELILPSGSVLSRKTKSGLHISTSRFNVTIIPEFHGFSTVFPPMFDELYLDKQFNEVHPYIVRIRIQIEFRWWAFFSATGWDYYEWLDSFLDKLTDAFSFDDFITSVGWNSAVSSAVAVKNLTKELNNPRANSSLNTDAPPSGGAPVS